MISEKHFQEGDTKTPELLGQGAQFKVFDIGDNKVLKIPLERNETQAVISSWYSTPPNNLEQTVNKAINDRERSISYIKQLLGNNPNASSFFGNPSFQPDGSIIQDRVKTVEEWMLHLEKIDQKSLLIDCIDAIKTGWEYGASDNVFNFMRNFGVDDSNKVIMIDFGELSPDINMAQDCIKNNEWLNSFDYNNVLDSEQQEFFAKHANESLTLASFERHWRKQIN